MFYNWNKINESFFDDIDTDITDDNIISNDTEKKLYKSFSNCETVEDYADLIYKESHIKEICDIIDKHQDDMIVTGTAKLQLEPYFKDKFNIITYTGKNVNKLTLYIDNILQINFFGWRTNSYLYLYTEFGRVISDTQIVLCGQPTTIDIDTQHDYKQIIYNYINKHFNQFKKLNTTESVNESFFDDIEDNIIDNSIMDKGIENYLYDRFDILDCLSAYDIADYIIKISKILKLYNILYNMDPRDVDNFISFVGDLKYKELLDPYEQYEYYIRKEEDTRVDYFIRAKEGFTITIKLYMIKSGIGFHIIFTDGYGENIYEISTNTLLSYSKSFEQNKEDIKLNIAILKEDIVSTLKLKNSNVYLKFIDIVSDLKNIKKWHVYDIITYNSIDEITKVLEISNNKRELVSAAVQLIWNKNRMLIVDTKTMLYNYINLYITIFNKYGCKFTWEFKDYINKYNIFNKVSYVEVMYNYLQFIEDKKQKRGYNRLPLY